MRDAFGDQTCYFKIMATKYISLMILLFLSLSAPAQELKNLGIESRWNKGTVTLLDKTILVGEIRYNDVQGSVLFRTSDKDEQLFLKSNILTLEYFDYKEGATRQFCSLALNNEEAGEEVTDLFEVIKMFDGFVVLASKSKLQTQRQEISYPITSANAHLPYVFSKNAALKLSQSEQFYFLSEDGNPELYLTLEHTYVDTKLYKYKKNSGRVFDKYIFSKYLGAHWPSVMQYVTKNKIKLDSREGIIATLNFYTDLLNVSARLSR